MNVPIRSLSAEQPATKEMCKYTYCPHFPTSGSQFIHTLSDHFSMRFVHSQAMAEPMSRTPDTQLRAATRGK